MAPLGCIRKTTIIIIYYIYKYLSIWAELSITISLQIKSPLKA
jgi:hypothetical protein